MYNKIARECANFLDVIKIEYKAIFNDGGVMLILFGAIFIYSTLYSFAYHNQVVRDIPIAVVDESGTPMAREFIRALDASSSLHVAYEPTNLNSAKQLFYLRNVYGVIVIPDNFEKNILRKEQAKFVIYADASYFLMYKNLFAAATATMAVQNYKLELATFMQAGMSSEAATALADPVGLNTVKLFNRIDGYATFVMPAIMLLIIQQTLLISIGMIGGTFRERKLYHYYRNKDGKWYSAWSVVFGKLITYLVLLIGVCLVIFGVYYKLFGYPSRAGRFDFLFYIVPYIISSAAAAIALSTVFRKRESAILLLVVWSIPFLLLSAVSFPREGMPHWLYFIGQIIPSSSAIGGFIRLEVMGATLKDISVQYSIMWGLSILYTSIALFTMSFRMKKAKKILK
ncbi:MAG: ABC transporter permease [Rikenellaceae bacterium]